MKLEDIGFYTLTDVRASSSSHTSPLHRCELILTSACNFKCPYCRGIQDEHCGSMKYEEAIRIVDIWCNNGLKNIRFSGGEPTLWKKLPELVKHTKARNVERIAISTNGSADLEYYKNLIELGVNDFSISLDSCCQENGDKMAGGKKGAWQKVVDNIRELSKLTYVTVGVVLTEDNICEFKDIVRFAHYDLGVSDIRIISSAQWNKNVGAFDFEDEIITKHPILKYRAKNVENGLHVRGITENDNHRCPLTLDDMAVLNSEHYPCIIYLREQGKSLGRIDSNVREVRKNFAENHNTYEDPICRKNCLDVCVSYNNRHKELHEKN
jgi:molybdenum cofactor biosynthesis enzyme MoaA